MKKVCVVTAARSEYGHLHWIIDGINKSNKLCLQIIVTGSHLSPEYGNTVRYIEEDGYYIDERVEMLLSSKTSVGIAKSMGVCALCIGDAFRRLQPDMIVVLGDRYELLPICSVALVMGIPIAHISGGDVTKGAIDDQVRNAVTMMATLHFPSTEDSAFNISRMRGCDRNIYIAGEPSLDNFLRCRLMTREELAEDLKIDINKRWFLITLHSETKKSENYNLSMAKNMVEAIKSINDAQFVITKANADLYGYEINNYLQAIATANKDSIRFIDSLGHSRYMSFMKQVECVIGNSSSGIVEAPFLGKWVINIGDRQKGRYQCNNVIQVANDLEQLVNALKCVYSDVAPDYYYGDGHGAETIVKKIEYFLCQK